MSEREWWPVDLLDESMPPGRDGPSDWIIGLSGDLYAIANGYGDEDDDGVLDRIAPGGFMTFCYCDRLPSAFVTFNADGTVAAHTGIPAGANWCRIADDQDTLQDDLLSLAKWIVDPEGGADRELLGAQTVEFAFWSDSFVHELVVDPVDRRARFILCGRRQ